jgi:hypothetical protein
VSNFSKLLGTRSEKAQVYIALNAPTSKRTVPYLDFLFTENNEKKKLNFRFTDDIEEASCVLVPTDLSYWAKDKNYNRYLQDLSAKKKLIIFNSSDFIVKSSFLNNTIYFRHFLDPGQIDPNVIIVPYNIKSIVSARKKSTKRIIVFMGQSHRVTPTRLFYSIKNSFKHPIKGNGSLVRKIMLHKVKKIKISNQIILKDKFYANAKLETTEFENNYKHYVESFNLARYVLCPRGDGNQSLRFYETLSAGRIPIIIDTDLKTPLDGQIDLSSLSITLKLSQSAKTWERIILDFDSKFQNVDFAVLSKKIYELYDKRLSPYNFWRELFIDFIYE